MQWQEKKTQRTKEEEKKWYIEVELSLFKWMLDMAETSMYMQLMSCDTW